MGCRVGGELTAPSGDHVDEDGIITSYFLKSNPITAPYSPLFLATWLIDKLALHYLHRSFICGSSHPSGLAG
jgi:hypothetical protein